MRGELARLTIFVAVIAVAGELAAAGDGPGLEIAAPDAVVSVGDHVPIRVSARGGEGWLWGELGVRIEELGPWEVVDGPRNVVGAHPPAWELVLAPMSVGEEPLPEIAVAVRPPDGEPRLVTPSQVPVVTIASVLPPDQEVEWALKGSAVAPFEMARLPKEDERSRLNR